MTFCGQVMVGPCASFTVTVKEHKVTLPAKSVARQITVLLPLGKAEPLAKPLTRDTLTEVQLSAPVTV